MIVIGISTLFLLSLIYASYNSIRQLRKKQIIDAEIISFDPHFKVDVDENVNFLLTVNLYLPNEERQLIDVKGLYLKQPKKGDNIKILLDDDNIHQSKIFTGTEISMLYITIFVYCMVLFSIYYFYFQISG